jgi:D-alanine-D-alanine ligase
MSGYGRADWKLDSNGNPNFLELNLTPGLSKYYSSLPLCFSIDLSKYDEMVQESLNAAIKEYEDHSREYGKTYR